MQEGKVVYASITTMDSQEEDHPAMATRKTEEEVLEVGVLEEWAMGLHYFLYIYNATKLTI